MRVALQLIRLGMGLPLALDLATRALATDYTVPSSIEHACARDVTNALGNWIASVPDGTATAYSVIRFPADHCYRIDGTLNLPARHHLTLAGKAELRAVADMPVNGTRAQLQLDRGHDIRIINLTIRGANPDGGGYQVALEHDYAVNILGTQKVRLHGVKLLNARGDGVQLSPGGSWNAQGVGAIIPADVRIRNAEFRSIGRHAVTCTACDGLWVQDSIIDKIGFCGIDVEGEAPVWPTRHIRVTGNTVTTVNASFYAGVSGFMFDQADVVIARNTVGPRTNCIPTIGIGSGIGISRGLRIRDNSLQGLAASINLTNVVDVEISGNYSTGHGTCNVPGAGIVVNGADGFRVWENVFPEANGVFEVPVPSLPPWNLVSRDNALGAISN